ncbi:pesticidal protein Cry7Aa [Candidatus Woesearchaeota archaeon]|nr:pesticidal protein Cry7Aa [Candidatus Woesearchaeota archaeon]
MVEVKKEGIILEASKLNFENQAVLNPATVKIGNTVHMFYRAVKQGNYSSIGYAKLDGPLNVIERAKKPILKPEFPYEIHGVEDPRVVKIDGTYYMTYMAYDNKNVSTAYAVSKDLKTWSKKGEISSFLSYAAIKKMFMKLDMPDGYFNFDIYNKSEKDTADTVYVWGKDAVLFPKKINGKFAMLHRVLPNIHLIYFKDFKELTHEYWEEHFKNLSDFIVLDKRHWFESRALGAGAPPVETKKGWLMIYHAIENSPEGRIYRAGAALLDKKDPTKIIGRLCDPLFSPEKEWEKKGDVDNVVFPSGTAIFGNKLYIYYGAADKRIAAVSLDINELLDELVKNGNN